MKRWFALSLLLFFLGRPLLAYATDEEVISAKRAMTPEALESSQITSKEIDLFQELKWAYGKPLISKPLLEFFLLRELKGELPKPICPDLSK